MLEGRFVRGCCAVGLCRTFRKYSFNYIFLQGGFLQSGISAGRGLAEAAAQPAHINDSRSKKSNRKFLVEYFGSLMGHHPDPGRRITAEGDMNHIRSRIGIDVAN